MELTVNDVRAMIGGYVLELIGKDKEIAELRAEVEKLREELRKDKPRDGKEIANFGAARPD